MEVVL